MRNELLRTNSDGSVSLLGRNFTEQWFPWDHTSGGFRIEGAQPDEAGGTRPILFQLVISGTLGSDHPLTRLFYTVPERVRTLARHMPIHGYETLLLAQNHMAEVIACPTLLLPSVLRVYCLPMSMLDLDCDWRGWVSQVCAYPKEAISVARRFNWMFDWPDIADLWGVLAQRDLLRVLAHRPKVYALHIEFCQSYPEVSARSPRLLGGLEAVSPIPNLVAEVLQFRERLGHVDKWPYRGEIGSVEDLRRIHLKLKEEVAGKGMWDEALYPLPPYEPDEILRPVSNFSELVDLAEEYGNCLATYHSRCLTGRAAVYEVRDDPTFVAVFTRKMGNWELDGAEYRGGLRASTEAIQALFERIGGAL